MKLPLIPQDKANHIVYGFVIYFIANLFLNTYYSLGIVIIFALSKEAIDQVKYKGFDWKDLVVTLIPAIMFLIKFLILKD